MKLIQILVLVAAMALAAAAQNTSSTSQNSGSNAKATTNQTQKKAASSTAAKTNPSARNPQSSGSSQTSAVKLIVPKTASATKSSATGNAKVSASTGSVKKVQRISAKPSSAAKSNAPVKTPVLAVKPAPKPAPKTTNAKNASLAATIKKKVEAQKKNPVKIVPQKVANVDKPAAKETAVALGARRDPFLSIIRNMPSSPAGPNCSVGKRCLFIPELELKGIAKDPDGQMMAVVVSNTHRAYFLRENDQVFNGSVQKITTDSVVFREFATDHLGRETAHEVVKKIPRS